MAFAHRRRARRARSQSSLRGPVGDVARTCGRPRACFIWRRDRVGDLRAAVAEVGVPERRGAVEVARRRPRRRPTAPSPRSMMSSSRETAPMSANGCQKAMARQPSAARTAAPASRTGRARDRLRLPAPEAVDRAVETLERHLDTGAHGASRRSARPRRAAGRDSAVRIRARAAGRSGRRARSGEASGSQAVGAVEVEVPEAPHRGRGEAEALVELAVGRRVRCPRRSPGRSAAGTSSCVLERGARRPRRGCRPRCRRATTSALDRRAVTRRARPRAPPGTGARARAGSRC